MSALLRTQWDRVTAWVCTAIGVLLLIIGYFRVSGTAYPAEQIPYLISAGLGALFLLGMAGTLWVSADLRDEHAKLEEIAELLRSQASASAEDAGVVGEQLSPLPSETHAAIEEPVASLDARPRRRPRAAGAAARESSATSSTVSA